MRTVDMRVPGGGTDAARLARLTRHWKARLEDFEPGMTQVCAADQGTGQVTARFPGRDAGEVAAQLERRGVLSVLRGEKLCFFLRPELPFEDLDYAWGCLNEIL